MRQDGVRVLLRHIRRLDDGSSGGSQLRHESLAHTLRRGRAVATIPQRSLHHLSHHHAYAGAADIEHGYQAIVAFRCVHSVVSR